MRMKSLLGAVAAATIATFATQAIAVPAFQLRIKSGTYDSGAIAGTTGNSGLVVSTVPNINGGGGNKFTSSGLNVQGSFSYVNSVLSLSLDVPDIMHRSSSSGTIDFYLTLYNLTAPTGGPMKFQYDLNGTNDAPHVLGPDNSSQGWFYYSAANSHNPVVSPGLALVTTPVIATNFAATPDCQLSGPGSLSYSCEYISPVTVTPLYSLTEKLELKFAQNTKNKTARGQVSVVIPVAVPEPATLALLGSGLLAAGARFRRRKTRKRKRADQGFPKLTSSETAAPSLRGSEAPKFTLALKSRCTA